MTEIPKAAHRNDAQRIVGYLNASREALKTASRIARRNGVEYGRITSMIEDIDRLETDLYNG